MVTILRYDPPWGTTDEYGDPVHTVDSPADEIEIDAHIAPRTSSDVDGLGRSGVVIGLELICLDPAADIVSTDVVLYRGERWEIDGEIAVWDDSPFGDLAQGLTCALKRGQG